MILPWEVVDFCLNLTTMYKIKTMNKPLENFTFMDKNSTLIHIQYVLCNILTSFLLSYYHIYSKFIG